MSDRATSAGETYRIVSTWEIDANSLEDAKEEFRRRSLASQLPDETWTLLGPDGEEIEQIGGEE